jgi:hypothetical protein
MPNFDVNELRVLISERGTVSFTPDKNIIDGLKHYRNLDNPIMLSILILEAKQIATILATRDVEQVRRRRSSLKSFAPFWIFATDERRRCLDHGVCGLLNWPVLDRLCIAARCDRRVCGGLR